MQKGVRGSVSRQELGEDLSAQIWTINQVQGHGEP